MKKILTLIVLAGAGVLVWRRVQQNSADDLWSQAENAVDSLSDKLGK